MKIIGRKREIEEFREIYESDKPEFVALFGRRRVGKTFLVNELFSQRFAFKHTALSVVEDESGKKVTNTDQLNHFAESLKRYGYKGNRTIDNWFQAFYALEDLLEESTRERLVVFIDELPWLDMRGSKFASALEAFWNSWANNKNIVFIICGSASAWITKKMLNSYGGLYNRITREIELHQFSLQECSDYFQEKNIRFSRYDVVQLYMALGGVPYYLEKIDGRLSVYQNIDALFFAKNAPLKGEFSKLFKSTFKHPELIIEIIRLLSEKSIGFTREEISQKLSISEGGESSDAFNALISSGFIIKYRPLLANRKSQYYKLIDPFCLFYLLFVENDRSFDPNMFERNHDSPKIVSWRGLAFENVCFNHIEEIKKALQISVISSEQYPYIFYKDGKTVAQIDLIIDRKDEIVNLCEMKFYSDEYELDKQSYLNLVRKDKTLSQYIRKKQIIRNTLITTFGIVKNEFSSLFNYVLTLDDLFIQT